MAISIFFETWLFLVKMAIPRDIFSGFFEVGFVGHKPEVWQFNCWWGRAVTPTKFQRNVIKLPARLLGFIVCESVGVYMA